MTQDKDNHIVKDNHTSINSKDIRMMIVAMFLGVIAISAVLYITFVLKPQKGMEQDVLWTILSLGMGCITAILPGILNLEIPNFIRAGGALAVLVLVYTHKPASEPIIPGGETITDIDTGGKADSSLAQKAADSYLALVDAGKYEEAYEVSASWAKENYKKDVFIDLFTNTRNALDKVNNRKLVGVNAHFIPPAEIHYPNGYFTLLAYLTDYSGDKSNKTCEQILLFSPKMNLDWKVISYVINSGMCK
jgi:hypothetical protein